jgi:hypothetical protein
MTAIHGSAIVIDEVTASGDNGTSKVRAGIDGREIWFESRDQELWPRAEAFASLALVPAVRAGRDLIIKGTVDHTWLANTARLMDIYSGWWGCDPIKISASEVIKQPPRPAGPAAQLISGGIDSFFTLKMRTDDIGTLLHIHGLEIDHRRQDLMDNFREALENIASHFGKKLTVIRTNLAELPGFRGATAQATAGGAFAAMAHIQSGAAKLIISASAHESEILPWCSTPQTDPLFGSADLTIEHYGEKFRRIEKVRAVMDDPTLQENLRVCMQREGAARNCGECETCIRLMVTLRSLGKLEKFTSLPQDKDLTDLVRKMPALLPVLLFYWKELDTSSMNPELARAVKALIRQSNRRQNRLLSFIRNLDSTIRRNLPRPGRTRNRPSGA